MSTNGIEKRRYERIGTERPVTLSNFTSSHQAKMLDISIKGVGILSPNHYEINEKITLLFRLPTLGEQPLKLTARVVHITKVRDEFLIGFEFDSSAPSAENAIEEYIHYHKRQIHQHN